MNSKVLEFWSLGNWLDSSKNDIIRSKGERREGKIQVQFRAFKVMREQPIVIILSSFGSKSLGMN